MMTLKGVGIQGTGISNSGEGPWRELVGRR